MAVFIHRVSIWLLWLSQSRPPCLYTEIRTELQADRRIRSMLSLFYSPAWPTKSQPPAILYPGPKPPPSCTLLELYKAIEILDTYSRVVIINASVYNCHCSTFSVNSGLVKLINTSIGMYRVVLSSDISVEHRRGLERCKPDLVHRPCLRNGEVVLERIDIFRVGLDAKPREYIRFEGFQDCCTLACELCG